jgi:dihydrofolate reductase
MRKLVYDVAASIDGFISHEDGSVEGLLHEGQHVVDYQERLRSYDTVLMGKKTYEWGYQFGLEPGKRPYPHMRHYVFSRSLRLPGGDVTVVDRDAIAVVERLKAEEGSDIYLCGGGAFAGFLLDHRLVDRLVIKVNPILFGHGVRLFGGSSTKIAVTAMEARPYSNGVVLLSGDLDTR